MVRDETGDIVWAWIVASVPGMPRKDRKRPDSKAIVFFQ